MGCHSPLQRLDAVIDGEWFRELIEVTFRIEPKDPGTVLPNRPGDDVQDPDPPEILWLHVQSPQTTYSQGHFQHFFATRKLQNGSKKI